MPKQAPKPTRDLQTFQRLMMQGANAVPMAFAPGHPALEGQREAESLADGLLAIRVSKVAAYGDSRYEVSDPLFDLTMCYSDIHRKTLRLKEILFNSEGVRSRLAMPGVSESVLDGAVDLAGYSLMLLHIIYRLWAAELIDLEVPE